ncbi:MAG: hypothetical protein RL199_21 [Pseudomonadota bacterium]
MTADELARDVADAAAKRIRDELRSWEEHARAALTEHCEPVVCCEDQEWTEFVVRDLDTGVIHVARLQPDGSVVKTVVTHCPFCGVRYQSEAE